MIVLAVLLLSSFSNIMRRADFQEMTGPAFQEFGQIADKVCASRRLRTLYPPDLYDLADAFEKQLSRQMRQRVAAHDKGFAGCPEAGASCPAQNKLDAIAKVNLLSSFSTSLASAATSIVFSLGVCFPPIPSISCAKPLPTRRLLEALPSAIGVELTLR